MYFSETKKKKRQSGTQGERVSIEPKERKKELKRVKKRKGLREIGKERQRKGDSMREKHI